MRPSLTEQLDQLPPCLVRLLARERRHCLTNQEIARRSGLSLKLVRKISHLPSWTSLRVGVAEDFARACNYDLLRPRRSLQYLARVKRNSSGLSHLNGQQLNTLSKILDRL